MELIKQKTEKEIKNIRQKEAEYLSYKEKCLNFLKFVEILIDSYKHIIRESGKDIL